MNSSTHVRRRALVLTAAAAMTGLPALAVAQGATGRIAVLSLFGAEVQVVTRKAPTGTNLTRNEVQSVAMGGIVDRAALTVAERVLLKLRRPEPVLLTSTSPSLHKQQDRFFDGSQAKVPEVFVKSARDDGATQLVLLTRYRSDAQFRTRENWVGVGPVEGAGFYIDTIERLKDWERMEERSGYLAAYAYIRMTLIDLATMRIVRERRLQGNGIVLQSAGDGSLNPWGALTNEQKMEWLNSVVADELERALPALLGEG